MSEKYAFVRDKKNITIVDIKDKKHIQSLKINNSLYIIMYLDLNMIQNLKE